VYAIVRCGGRQEKASVDDVLTVDRLSGEVGSTLTLPALLVVDGDNVVSDPTELGGYQVAAEILGDTKGPKINIVRYKNKTGYRRRLGHRQQYTQLKITGITKGGSASKASATKSSASKTAASKSSATRSSASKTSASKTSASKTSASKSPASKSPASKSRTASGTSKSAASTAASDKES
jgi:large subunit ribosomal protein L21